MFHVKHKGNIITIRFEGEDSPVTVTSAQFAIISKRCRDQVGPWKPLKREHAAGVLSDV